MYIADLIHLTMNWHWEGIGTATKTLKTTILREQFPTSY